ncbi:MULTISPECIES: type III pantothenate kinase [Marinobacter]|jgi:type III pantothenate kinase|uniref:Type III pantothenate kinase n=1 Tax=Marinobacter excellens LAMA 842 TaxID=1306954 RepID=A0A137S1K0_9GAMM|nr:MULTISPECIES: type III pantothenate kinase [Marinobacter]KXO06316.1 Pantothenate kinase type III, CoaX-like [Marinobacter excellens LAMA 842]MCD1632009.1 type III pantothenate kinase [Marinobacter shengliensis]
MILLLDCGNTRVKWRLMADGVVVHDGGGALEETVTFAELTPYARKIDRVAVSTVASEQSRLRLDESLATVTSAPVRYHWAEVSRDGLRNSYQEVAKMGADRWHAMLAAWVGARRSFAVVDAGSAVTIDYVDGQGQHLGGYILPGLHMMRRSLKLDAARIGFEYDEQINAAPGRSTGECANHGLAWLTESLVQRLHRDVGRLGLERVVLTGGDAGRFQSLGLKAEHRPGLVLEGLEIVDLQESQA